MDGPLEAPSEVLIIQNFNAMELKDKLNEIILSGKDFEYDVSACLKNLLQSSNQEVLLLTVQAISEIVKSEVKREKYAQKDIIEPILSCLCKDVTLDTLQLLKQCCRALGNLCCDCDMSRKIILESLNSLTIIKLLTTTLEDSNLPLCEIKVLICKVLLNYVIGGQEYSDPLVNEGVTKLIQRILAVELEKEIMDEDVVTTALLILSVINYNDPEILLEDDVNICVLNVLKEATSVEVSELCLEHFHSQTEHDSVKVLLAKEGGIQLVCCRLEQLVERLDLGEINADSEEVDKCMKKACDLIVIDLMGDEAMNLLYDKGNGELYQIMQKWLGSKNNHLLITGVLAMGNFARQDDHCVQMMEDNTFDKLLDIFEKYLALSVKTEEELSECSIDKATVLKIQEGALSAVRNLLVPVANKKVVAERGRAAPILINALPLVDNNTVAYKLLASLRMLIDGQESAARSLCAARADVARVCAWAQAPGRAAPEATRLLARAAALLPAGARRLLAQVEGCIQSLVNMMVSPHAIMQNESILTLTLLAIDTLQPENDHDNFITQLLKSEIGKHIAVLIETNCAKLSPNCVENLIAFLDVTSKNNSILLDYKEANVHESLEKLFSKAELCEKLVVCCKNIVFIISQVHAEV